MNIILKATPFLRWVGGKTQLLPELKKHLPEQFKNYYEPFLGGGALFFEIADEDKKAFLSDINPDLITTYRAVKNAPNTLIEKLKFHERYDSKSHFYFIRNLQNLIQEAVSRAARFIYLNKTCFRGMYRENKKGEFNNSYGNRKFNLNFQNLLNCSATLQNAKIERKDFERIRPKRNDFVYLDPPYHKEGSKSFTQYHKDDFTVKDHIRLKEFADKLSKKRVKWMISNSDTTFIRELYAEYKIYKVDVKRNFNPKRKNKHTTELIIKNY